MATEKKVGNVNGAQAVMYGLRDAGIHYVFGYPGGQALDLFQALGEMEDLELVLVRHEQAAVHAADGFARSTGKAGVALVTSGPGATNTVTGIATAYMDSIPVIVISAQVDTRLIGTDTFQEADITGITLPVVKHSYLVKDAIELPKTMAEAFYIATTGRPGPVLIDIPSDVAKQVFDYSKPEKVKLDSYRPTYRGNRRQVKQAASLLTKAQRPVLYVGGGIIASDASSELLELAELMNIPVAVTLTGKGCFPGHHRLSLGLPGMHGSMLANDALDESDLVIAVGARFSQRVTGRSADFAPEASVIHVDIDPAEIGKNHSTQVPIVGDAKTVLRELLEELVKRNAEPCDLPWLAEIDARRSEEQLPTVAYPGQISPESLMDAIDARLTERDAYIVTEVGQHQMWAAQRLSVDKPRHFIASCGLGTMGFGLPASMGVQLAHPSAKVVLIAGDGSIQMNIQEMATIALAKLPVLVIVLNNHCLGMVHQQARVFGYDIDFATDLPQDGQVPDFMQLAKAYGWQSARIDKPEEVDFALDAALACPEPCLLEVVIPHDASVLPMRTGDETFMSMPDEAQASGAKGKRG